MESLKSVDGLAFMQVGACLHHGGLLLKHTPASSNIFSLPSLVTGTVNYQSDASHIFVDYTAFAHKVQIGVCRLQAVSKGCQMITLPLPEPRWPFLSSFAGTAAHAGYCIILVCVSSNSSHLLTQPSLCEQALDNIGCFHALQLLSGRAGTGLLYR